MAWGLPLPGPGAPLEPWLAYKVSMDAAPAMRDRLLAAGSLVAALAQWLMRDDLLANERDGMTAPARQRVDGLWLAGMDAGSPSADEEWQRAGMAAAFVCWLIDGDGAAWRASDPTVAPLVQGLAGMHELWEPQFSELGPEHALGHPVWPLADAWIEAHRPAAKHATGPTGIAPRMQSVWRKAELATFVAPAGADIVLDSDAPALAWLPGMDPEQAAAELLPPFWWDLIGHALAAPMSYRVDPRRARTDALRVPRIALYVAGLPLVQQRVGVLAVEVDTWELVWALYPGDRERGLDGVKRTDRLAPVQRSIEQLDAYSRRVDGGVLFPIRRARWQSAAVIAGRKVKFDVTYPLRGGNGPAYDRGLMAAAGPNPRRFLAYLAAIFAMSRGASVDQDDLARSVHAGLPPATGRQIAKRRAAALDALAWLADWRPDGVQRVDFSHHRGVVRFSVPQRLLPG